MNMSCHVISYSPAAKFPALLFKEVTSIRKFRVLRAWRVIYDYIRVCFNITIQHKDRKMTLMLKYAEIDVKITAGNLHTNWRLPRL